ncbi:MAG: lipase family protein [Methylococcales bacterium]
MTKNPISLAIALEAAELVNQAYDQYQAWKDHKPWLISPDYDLIFEFYAKPFGTLSTKEPWGFIAVNKESRNTFVILRGTEPKSIGDLLTDAMCVQVDHPHGRVHYGFNEITNQLLETVKIIIGEGEAYFAGHSAGASVATLLADAFTADKAKAILFASPKTGNSTFKANYKIPTAGFVNAPWDEVPKSPESIPGLLDYEHVFNPITFDHPGDVLEAHALQTYLNAIKALIPQTETLI